MAQHLRVVGRVELQRAGALGPDEALAVERDAPVATQFRQCLGGKVRASKRPDVHPVRPLEPVQVGRAPGIAERLDDHHAAVALVAERERRSRVAAAPEHRQPEPHEGSQQRVAVGIGALRPDKGRLAEHAQRARRVEGSPPGPGR